MSFISDMISDVLIVINMGRKNEIGNSTSLVDQYRKQLGLKNFWNTICFQLLYFITGRHEKKIVTERRKEIKRLQSEQETVSYWKVRLWYVSKLELFQFVSFVWINRWFIFRKYSSDFGLEIVVGMYQTRTSVLSSETI
jgi:hypothetical protein